MGGGQYLPADPRRLRLCLRVRRRAQIPRDTAVSGGADLDQPNPVLRRRARARPAAVVLIMTRLNGRSAFLKLLVDEGVTHLFGNPGTTELPLMEVVPDFPELNYVLGLQEAVVVAMADGYARASNRLAACSLHVAPGLGNAMGALYTAKFSGSPLIVTCGQQEQGHGLLEPLLYAPLLPIAQPMVKWAVEVTRAEDLPRIVRRAAKLALTPPTGPVFISLPGDVLDAEVDLDFGKPTRVDARVRPSDEALAQLAAKLLEAKNPMILAGQELSIHDAFAEAAELAELLGAAVYQQPIPYCAQFPSAHPAYLGALTRNQKQVRAALEPFDLMLCLGADLLRMSVYSPTAPLPEAMPVVHISERDWELGKNYPTELALQASLAQQWQQGARRGHACGANHADRSALPD